jgi:catechol 2,3-dioxygenase-like lactoylglutathione lyase family enzyme
VKRPKPATPPLLTSVEAQLYVADVGAASAFFTAKLGFTQTFVDGEPPFYGHVRRGRARPNLRLVREPVFSGDVRERERLLAASITLATAAHARTLLAKFQAAGVRFARGLTDESWDALTFVVADPNGNLISFASPAGEATVT